MDKYYWLNDDSRTFLSRGYLDDNQTGEQRVRAISERAEQICRIVGFADKFELYMSRGWFSLSSPVWSNYGTTKGLPVSCFGSYVEDNMEGILQTLSEVGMLSKFGGGTSGYFGALRPRGSPIQKLGKSHGSVHFMEMFDNASNIISQGSVRRGHFSPYLPIEHPDFDEFIGIGSDGHPIQHLTHGVTVTDAFLNKMKDGDSEARRRWAKVIETRNEVGYPYVFFYDNVNNAKPKWFKDPIVASNMCSEIALPSNADETFVCVLSSMNLLHYDDWKDTDAVETLAIFLDTVCDEFITRAEEMRTERPKAIAMIDRAITFTKKWRALGLGVLGWHSYLQSKMIPFESQEAARLNIEIHKFVRNKADAATKWMAEWFGSPEGLIGTGRRNATLMAIAPTKSSSFILGNVSQGIEPEMSNYFVDDLAKIKITYKNPYLLTLLREKGMDNDDVWNSIMETDGSVQHLDFLSTLEKDVFKTFVEINPQVVIDQAAMRQQFIDQSQSLNLMIDPSMPTREINRLYLSAWESGVKTLYYQYNLNAAQATRREQYMNRDCAACGA